MKRILITGVRRGLGKVLSDFLIEKGYFIFGTTRDIGYVSTSEMLHLFYLDLTDNSSIDEMADFFVKTKTPIDALIHNAGIAYLDPADVLEEDECRNVFEVNFFGPLRLTNKVIPLMKKQEKSNIIFISSIVSVDHWPHLGVYAASKSAMEVVAFELAVLLKKWNIHVSIIQPNPLDTDMQILRSKNAKNSPYPELTNRKLIFEDVSEVCNIVSNILDGGCSKLQYQTGPESKKTFDHFFKKDAYQTSVEKYQNIHKKPL